MLPMLPMRFVCLLKLVILWYNESYQYVGLSLLLNLVPMKSCMNFGLSPFNLGHTTRQHFIFGKPTLLDKLLTFLDKNLS